MTIIHILLRKQKQLDVISSHLILLQCRNLSPCLQLKQMKYLSYLKEKNKNKNLHLCCIPSFFPQSSHPLESSSNPQVFIPTLASCCPISALASQQKLPNSLSMLTGCMTPIHSSVHSHASFCSHYATETPPNSSLHFLRCTLLLCQSATRDTINHIPLSRNILSLAWLSSCVISGGFSCYLKMFILQDSILSLMFSLCPFLSRQSLNSQTL